MQDLLKPPITTNWDWQLTAACRGMDVDAFYHPAGERNRRRERRIAQAKAICAHCPVITQCRQHALETREPYGVWGGLSEQERAELLGVHDLRYPAALPVTPTPDHCPAGPRSTPRLSLVEHHDPPRESPHEHRDWSRRP